MFGDKKSKWVKRLNAQDGLRYYFPDSMEVDLDALNHVSSGEADGFCRCAYSAEPSFHVFRYFYNNADTVSKQHVSDSDANCLLSSLYWAICTAESFNFSLDNIDTNFDSVFRGDNRFLFIYFPIKQKDYSTDISQFIYKFLKKYRNINTEIKEQFKKVKQSGDGMFVLKTNINSKNVSSCSFSPEGDTAVLSSPYADSEGETTVLSGLCADSEGETTVLRSPFADSEGATTVLSSPFADSEGETTVLSSSCTDSEGETTVLSSSCLGNESETFVNGAGTQYFERNLINEMVRSSFLKDTDNKNSALSDNSPDKFIFSEFDSSTLCQTARVFLLSIGGRSHYEIPVGELFVGSINERGFITLKNSSVSRRHAKIINTGERVLITDNNSTNGTYVDGRELAPGETAEVFNGSFVSFGNESFQIIVKRKG